MSTENLSIIGTFFVYLIGLVVIGRLSERKHSESYEDFVSAGKSLGGIVTALSAAASSESVWVMLGLSGLAYWKGLAAFWAAFGCIVGFLFNAIFITVQLRRDSARLGSLTVSDYIEARLGDDSGLLRKISSLLISFFMLSYVVAQFTGAGDLIHGMALFGTDTPYWIGVVVGAIVVAFYVVMGGYAAVCWTDTLQGILMFLVMLGLPLYALVIAGGFAGIEQVLGPMGLFHMTAVEGGGWALAGFVAGQLGIAIGYPGMPHMIVRFMTVSDDKEARRAAIVSIVWASVVLLGSALLGLAVRALMPDLAMTQKAAEQLVIPAFSRTYLHPILTGIVLSAVTAAIMSTADSQLMYAATSLMNDLWFKRKGAVIPDQKVMVRRTRWIILAMSGLALIVALLKMRLIYTFVLFAWGALGAAFTPIIILSLYWKKLTRWGALSSMIIGPVVVITWYNISFLHDAVYELIPAFFLSLLSAVLVSLWTYQGEKQNLETANQIRVDSSV